MHQGQTVEHLEGGHPGWVVNYKTIQRLWRDEGPRVPQWRGRKRFGTSTLPGPPKTDEPNKVGAVDFQLDATTDGRPSKIVSIVDRHTRECLSGLVNRSVTADILIDELKRIATTRGYPAEMRCDSGPKPCGPANQQSVVEQATRSRIGHDSLLIVVGHEAAGSTAQRSGPRSSESGQSFVGQAFERSAQRRTTDYVQLQTTATDDSHDGHQAELHLVRAEESFDDVGQ